jgi:hypothetical protein
MRSSPEAYKKPLARLPVLRARYIPEPDIPRIFYNVIFSTQCIIGIMKFLYYFRDCPTCKNHERNLVRECSLAVPEAEVIDRYILVLPEVWGEEASKIGAKLPFLYNVETGEALPVDHNVENMSDIIRDFLQGGTENPSELV